MNFRDVRMRGFEQRTRLAVVREWLTARCTPVAAERVSLAALAGRVLAEDIVAGRDVPPFRRSAMDGFALRGDETTGAGDYSPLRFSVVGESFPGHPFAGSLAPGQAVRIMTGAPVPERADAVLPAELAVDLGGSIEIVGSVPPGKNVGRVGEDMSRGATVLKRGRRLRPQDIGLLAALGIAEATAIRQPRVRLLLTGNELATVGGLADPFQIYDSNSWMLAPLVERDGGTLIETLLLRDDRDAIRDALDRPGADVVLLSGGSSVGIEDHAPSLLAERGEVAFHGIAMRPASPTGLGSLGDALVMLLPGNPVSCLCAYDLVAGLAIRLLAGRSGELPYREVKLPVAGKIVSAVGRVDYCRVKIVDGRVTPLAISGASILSSTCRADGFVLVPEALEGYGEGAEVTVYWYDSEPAGSAHV